MLGAIVLHCPLARRISTAIVHDEVPARRQPGVEVVQGLNCGLVQPPSRLLRPRCAPPGSVGSPRTSPRETEPVHREARIAGSWPRHLIVGRQALADGRSSSHPRRARPGRSDHRSRQTEGPEPDAPAHSPCGTATTVLHIATMTPPEHRGPAPRSKPRRARRDWECSPSLRARLSNSMFGDSVYPNATTMSDALQRPYLTHFRYTDPVSISANPPGTGVRRAKRRCLGGIPLWSPSA